MNKKVFLSFLLAMPLMASAQNINTTTPVVDLGSIEYEKPSTATFTLKNVSKKTLTITAVDTGCGCTKADYQKTAIAPGKQAKLTLTYDARQLGHFQKPVLVFNDSEETPYEVTIKGVVVASTQAKTSVPRKKKSEGVAIGSLRANENYVEFDDVHKGDRLVRELYITNTSSEAVEPVVMRLPSYLEAEVIPARIDPSRSGVVRLSLNSSNLRTYGLNQTNVYLASQPGENISEDKAVAVSVVLIPELVSDDAPERVNAPVVQLSQNEVDMSADKKKIKETIVIKNAGKSDLVISNMQMTTLGLEVTLSNSTIKPGKTAKLKITGTPSVLKEQRKRPRILMITNDPDNQKVVVDIKRD